MMQPHPHPHPSPSRKEPLSKLEPVPLTRADWDHLLEERFSIMVESGVSEGRAKALATYDTVLRHGHRPGVDL